MLIALFSSKGGDYSSGRLIEGRLLLEEIRYPFTISCPPDLSSVLSSFHQALYCVSHHKTCTWLTVINSLMNRSRVTEDSYLNLPVPSQEIAVSVVILLAIAITVGTVGNFGVCAILARRRDLRYVPHQLLASLSLNGLLSSLISAPAILEMAAVNYFPGIGKVPLDILCKIGYSSSMGFTVINASTLSMMAIDRQDCVIFPLKRRLSPTNVKRVIFVTWVAGFLFALLHGLILRKESSVCSRMDPYNSFVTIPDNHIIVLYSVVLRTIPNVITAIVIVITIFRILKKLRSHIFTRLTSVNRRREYKITKMTLQICAIFLISWFPNIITTSMVRVGAFRGVAVTQLIKLFAVVISKFNYVANPLLHFKMLQITPPNRHFLTPNFRVAKIATVDDDSIKTTAM